jgi:hypothetical protein
MRNSRGDTSSAATVDNNDNDNTFRFSLYLAREQHGACCHFSTCSRSSTTSKRNNNTTSLDDILTLADACDKTDGEVVLYVKDVNPGDGIEEIA